VGFLITSKSVNIESKKETGFSLNPK